MKARDFDVKSRVPSDSASSDGDIEIVGDSVDGDIDDVSDNTITHVTIGYSEDGEVHDDLPDLVAFPPVDTGPHDVDEVAEDIDEAFPPEEFGGTVTDEDGEVEADSELPYRPLSQATLDMMIAMQPYLWSDDDDDFELQSVTGAVPAYHGSAAVGSTAP